MNFRAFVQWMQPRFIHSLKKERLLTFFFFSSKEEEDSSFITDSNASLLSQCQQIQYNSAKEWNIKVCDTEKPQHYVAMEKYELNWLSFLKV